MLGLLRGSGGWLALYDVWEGSRERERGKGKRGMRTPITKSPPCSQQRSWVRGHDTVDFLISTVAGAGAISSDPLQQTCGDSALAVGGVDD